MKKIQTINNSIAVLTSALDALTRANTSTGDTTHANEMKTITKKIVKLSKKL